jgi:dTDP-4-amino-4,6-dideoxy-D-glucose transaminase
LGWEQRKRLDAPPPPPAAIDAQYRAGLAGIDGIFYLPDAGEKVANYAYFPIMVRPEYPLSRDALYQKLRDNKVFARRYFYPLISDFPMYRSLSSAAPANLPNARLVAETIICLPMSSNLRDEDVERVVSCIAD